MNNNLRIVLAAFLLLMTPGLLSAIDKDGETGRLSFTPVTLKGKSISSSLMNDVIKKIQAPLRTEDFFVLNERREAGDGITYANCLENKCITGLAGIAPEGIAVLVFLTSERVKTSEKEVSRYMDADSETTRYTIHVVTADAVNMKYDLVFKKTLNKPALLLKEADAIGKSIKKHYIKRKPAKEKTSKDQPVNEEQEETGYYNITDVTCNLSMMFPFGEFSDITKYGIGAEAVLNGRSPIIPHITINPGITAYWLSPATDNINSVYMILPEVTFAYGIQLSEKLVLAPAAGAGYSFMFIDGATVNGSGMKFYYNPALKAGIEAMYILSPGCGIFTSASYRCIFETDSLLQSADIKLGIRMAL